MIGKAKLYFLHKWLHLLTDQQLEDELLRRKFYNAYRNLTEKMINNFYEEQS